MRQNFLNFRKSKKSFFIGSKLDLKIKNSTFHEKTLFFKCIHQLLRFGKKEKIENLFIKLITTKAYPDLFLNLLKMIEKLKPNIDILPAVKRGKVFKVPTSVNSTRNLKLGLKFFNVGVQKRKEINFKQRIIGEIADVNSKRKCYSISLRNEMWKIAFFNRAFIHYRWR